MAKLHLVPCEPADVAEIFEAHKAAFTSPPEPFWYVLFPEGEAREKATKRILDWWLGDKSAKYMKVVDEETGEIASAAKWCIYEQPLTQEEMHERLAVNWHADGDSNEWAEHLIHWIHQHRLERTKGGKCCVLDILSTRPDYQCRGAGSMLVKWGTDIADTMGVESFIEGTATARHLYESNGFVVRPDGWKVVPVPEKWRERPQVKFLFFERPPRT